MTEQTVFGPFHRNGAPHLPHGANIAEGVAGEPCFVSALVKSAAGKPIAGATVDVWQAGADGFYDVQHPEWQEMNYGRCSRLTQRDVFGCAPSNRVVTLYQRMVQWATCYRPYTKIPTVRPICIV